MLHSNQRLPYRTNEPNRQEVFFQWRSRSDYGIMEQFVLEKGETVICVWYFTMILSHGEWCFFNNDADFLKNTRGEVYIIKMMFLLLFFCFGPMKYLFLWNFKQCIKNFIKVIIPNLYNYIVLEFYYVTSGFKCKLSSTVEYVWYALF